MTTHKPILASTLAALALAAWSGTALAQLSYNFNAVPKSGKAKFPGWPFYYFSYFNGAEKSGIAGGLAWRYAGNVSPAENFDKAFGYASKVEAAKLEAWGRCAYKAKQACVGGRRVDYKCLDKPAVARAHAACVKNFTVDSATEHEVVHQGIGNLRADKWWGICHGAAPATVLFPEPVKDVTYKGVKFRAKDIQALLSAVATSTELEPGGWAGCRNETKDSFEPSPGCPTLQRAAEDVTPRQYHAFFGHFLGTRAKGFVADVSTGPEVWNQGVDRFETTCTAGGTGCKAGEEPHTCRTSFRYDNDMWTLETANGRDDPRFFTTRSLSYTLCVKGGLIAGEGKWNHDPNMDKDALQPDFLWAPKGIGSADDASNPFIFAKAREIIERLAKPSAGVVAPPSRERETRVTVKKAIPDNNAAGVKASVTVGKGETGKFATFSVCLSITHPRRADLLVKGTYAGATETFWRMEGGNTANLSQCISSARFIGKAMGKAFTLSVADKSRGGAGRLNAFSVRWTKK